MLLPSACGQQHEPLFIYSFFVISKLYLMNLEDAFGVCKVGGVPFHLVFLTAGQSEEPSNLCPAGVSLIQPDVT